MSNFQDYQNANMRIAEIESILVNETESFYEIGEEKLTQEKNELEKYVIEVEDKEHWVWLDVRR